MAEVLGFVGFGLAVFTLVSCLISVSIDYWIHKRWTYLKLHTSGHKHSDQKNMEDAAISGLGKMVQPQGYEALLSLDETRQQRDEAYSGIWRSCNKDGDCASIEATFSLQTVQIMVILGLVGTLVAVVCGALKLFVIKDKKRLMFASAGFLASNGLFLVIGSAVYYSNVYTPRQSTYDLHVGFAFCVVACMASLIAAPLFCLD